MDTQIIVVFCLCADMLKSFHHYQDPQCRMSDAEVMTTAMVAMLYFRGNFRLARKNSLRPVPAFMTYFQARIRKIIETTGSLIERLLPKSIHAVPAKVLRSKSLFLPSLARSI